MTVILNPDTKFMLYVNKTYIIFMYNMIVILYFFLTEII